MVDESQLILTDNAITTRVLDIIRNAHKQVALVSPYVDEVLHVQQELLKAKARNVEVLIVVRKDPSSVGGNNSGAALSWFSDQGFAVQAVPNLHAKFYINETEGIITSMNLLKSSWSGSLEVGVAVSGEQHARLVDYLEGHLKVFFSSAELASKIPLSSSVPSRPTPEEPARPKRSGGLGALIKNLMTGPGGYCIRCGEALSADHAESGKVLCTTDYRAWAKYKNPDFQEGYCSSCGKRSKTSYAKPLCEGCYRR
jgi:hypothetical protein